MSTLETQYFLPWMEKHLSSQACSVACEAFAFGKSLIPSLHEAGNTPQSPPWHGEGPFLEDHLLRALTGFFAIRDGESLFSIEEIAREKSRALAFWELQETLRQESPLLIAFILLHDAAKPECLVFDAPQASKGAREGFIQHKHRVKAHASAEERRLYSKLLRAFAILHPTLKRHELGARFFDAYEIHTHYPQHAEKMIQPSKQEILKNVFTAFRLTDSEQQELLFLLKYHMDHVEWFKGEEHPTCMKVIEHRAKKAGIDSSRVFSLIFATLFLDTFFGSLHYETGVFRALLEPSLHFLSCEEWAIPERHAKRLQKESDTQEATFRRIMTEAKLDGESVFSLLKTPFGKERGTIMTRIHALVAGKHVSSDFGDATSEMEKRIQDARNRFDGQASA